MAGRIGNPSKTSSPERVAMQGENHEIVEMVVGELEDTLKELLESIPRAEKAAPYP